MGVLDLSYENYTPPTDAGATSLPSKEEQFINGVKDLAEKIGVEYVVATRNGKYAASVNESQVLKEIETTVIEINGRPENVPMNN